MPVTNEEIAAIFETMATLLEMKGDSIFKIRAYQRAARTIGELSFSLEQGVKDQVDFKKIPGIGKAISDKIQEYCQSGGIATYDRLVGELPDGVLTMMSIPGVGPKTAMLIARELGVSTIEGVEKEILAGKLATLPGLGPKTAETILRHIRVLGSKDGRTPLGQALSVAEATVDYLKEQCPDLGELLPAGSLRRWEETIGDIDLVGGGRKGRNLLFLPGGRQRGSGVHSGPAGGAGTGFQRKPAWCWSRASRWTLGLGRGILSAPYSNILPAASSTISA